MLLLTRSCGKLTRNNCVQTIQKTKYLNICSSYIAEDLKTYYSKTFNFQKVKETHKKGELYLEEVSKLCP